VPSPRPPGLLAVLYLSKKLARTASGTAPALCTRTSAPCPPSIDTVTLPDSGEASTAFFSRLASIE
jgi:hypothetical protein